MQEKQGSIEAKEKLVVVSNSSVIIVLARICRLDLLEKLFKKIVVPEAVWSEATVKGKPVNTRKSYELPEGRYFRWWH